MTGSIISPWRRLVYVNHLRLASEWKEEKGEEKGEESHLGADVVSTLLLHVSSNRRATSMGCGKNNLTRACAGANRDWQLMWPTSR